MYNYSSPIFLLWAEFDLYVFIWYVVKWYKWEKNKTKISIYTNKGNNKITELRAMIYMYYLNPSLK